MTMVGASRRLVIRNYSHPLCTRTARVLSSGGSLRRKFERNHPFTQAPCTFKTMMYKTPISIARQRRSSTNCKICGKCSPGGDGDNLELCGCFQFVLGIFCKACAGFSHVIGLVYVFFLHFRVVIYQRQELFIVWERYFQCILRSCVCWPNHCHQTHHCHSEIDVKRTRQCCDVPYVFGFLSLNGSGRSKTAPVDFNTRRSEEHTSELQSLMRISYAVFCLKKK